MVNIIELLVENKDFRKRVFVFTSIMIFLIIFAIVYILFFYVKPCNSKECYLNGIQNCNKISWIKEDNKSAWHYNLIGKNDKNSCLVEVKLLKIKQGTIDIESLQGKSMTCIVNKIDAEDPEKDISKCSGKLKEQIQEILIQRMHSYLLENVGELKLNFMENLSYQY